MGDRSWMQVTIGRRPTKRAKVANLLRNYVYLGDDDTEVTDGTSYDTDEIALGSAVELAGELIRLAPQCSFAAVQDGFYGSLGDQVLYTPRLGRFDGEPTGEAGTVLTHGQVETILASAAEHAWTERDTMLRLHRADLTPASIRAWESRPGVAEAAEVAYGIPWDAELTGGKVPLAKRRAWLAVIAAVGGGEAQLAGALRQLADEAGAVPVHGQASYLPMRLKTWAEIAATAYEGRRKGRRPDHASGAKKAARLR